MKADKTLAAINKKLEEEQEQEHRGHLGASLIGERCPRKIWYSFRWAAKELFKGRMLRLFDRGHLEENRFIEWLRMIGAEIWPVDPRTGKQWRINFGKGHGGGSCDSVGRGIPELPPTPQFPKGTPFVGEYKTHNEKSFKRIKKDGLCLAHEKHFAQMQSYMWGLGVPAALYCAVNKNDDDLHLELVGYNRSFAEGLIKKGEEIIEAETPPPKINQSPGFFLCRFCKFSDICHFGKAPEMNCRTCQHLKPVEGGQWLCTKYNVWRGREEQAAGCGSYQVSDAFKSGPIITTGEE